MYVQNSYLKSYFKSIFVVVFAVALTRTEISAVGASVSPFSNNCWLSFAKTKLFLSQDFKSGFGVNPDGELISVFALEKSRGKILVKEAREQGALYLCCMGEHLLNLYSEFGFSPINILKWDNRFAPKGWNYERFGEPNLYEMRLISPYDIDK